MCLRSQERPGASRAEPREYGSMNDFDPKRLRAAFARYMTGVTVVTARGARGEPAGFTAGCQSRR